MELEAMASNSNSNSNSNSSTSTSTGGGDDSSPPTAVVVKGKRTKRPRAPSSPPPATSSTSSADLSGTTEEEEDMAHCLILLAQGAHRSLPTAAAGPAPPTAEKFVSRRFAEAATSAGGAKAGFYVYECKTCSKCFPSFQALGGHRASHKKPKLQPAPPLPLPPPPATATSPDDYHRKPPVLVDEASLEITMNSFSAKQAVSAGKTSRVHECSICGSEFSSGQALGGHMRRHRLAVVPDSPDVKKEQRNVLSLDLNLPAPSDEERTADLATAFSFGGGRQMVFPATAAALVDCHY